jgi:2'-5' RNA ligase
MRLFVALEISEAVRRRAAAVIEDLSPRLERGAARIAWVPPERLHVTVQFIGHVDAGVAADVQERLAPAYRVAPFSLRVSGLGLFPAAGRPRVVWLGLRGGGEGLQHVHAETLRRLEGIEFRRESRPFAPHLTIGRFREPGAARLRRELAESGVADAGRCTIDHVTLFESRLSPRGPTYVPLRRAPFIARG